MVPAVVICYNSSTCMTIPKAESGPKPPSPDNRIITYSCSAVCNACGQSFTLSIRDENPKQAEANLLTVLTIQHGIFGELGIPLCTKGGGKSTDDYTQIEAKRI